MNKDEKIAKLKARNFELVSMREQLENQLRQVTTELISNNSQIQLLQQMIIEENANLNKKSGGKK